MTVAEREDLSVAGPCALAVCDETAPPGHRFCCHEHLVRACTEPVKASPQPVHGSVDEPPAELVPDVVPAPELVPDVPAPAPDLVPTSPPDPADVIDAPRSVHSWEKRPVDHDLVRRRAADGIGY